MVRPTRKSRSPRNKCRRRRHPVRLPWHIVRLIAILSFVCLAVITVGFALAENAQVAFGQSSQATDTCNPTVLQTDNHGASEKWYSINSGSAADILNAVKCTDMFQSSLQGNDLIAYALQNGTLAAPVLVKPYRSNVGLGQFWVVPVVDKNDYPLALLTFLYDPQSRQLHEAAFDAVTNDMFYVHRVFPAVAANAATTAVGAEHHVAMAQGRTLDLIYFPGDQEAFRTGKKTWTAGGTAVIDPIWRVPGEDGKWYYVDHNGHTHLNADLPVDPAYQPAPATTDIQ